MAFLHLRFLSLFVAFFAPVFAAILARWVPKYERTKEIYVLNAAIILALVAAMVWYFPSRSDYARIVAKSFPVGSGRLFEYACRTRSHLQQLFFWWLPHICPGTRKQSVY